MMAVTAADMAGTADMMADTITIVMAGTTVTTGTDTGGEYILRRIMKKERGDPPAPSRTTNT
jgi:hypothetical protein